MSTLLPNPDMPMRVSVAPFGAPGRDMAALSIVLGLRQPVPRETRVVEKIDLTTIGGCDLGGEKLWAGEGAMSLEPISSMERASEGE